MPKPLAVASPPEAPKLSDLEALSARVRELEERNRQLQLLHGVARAITAEPELDRLVQRLLETARELLRAHLGALALVVEEDRLRHFFTGGWTPGAREWIASLLEGWGRAHVMQQDTSLRLEELTTHPAGAGFPPEPPPVGSLLGVPIRFRGEVLGALYLFEKRGGFTADDERLLTTLCGDAAVAVANARLLAEEQRLRREAQGKNTELDTFVYCVSHDLKAPLVTIQGMSSVLLDDFGEELDPQARHYLQRIQANVQQMEQFIMDLLALSRVGREGRPPEPVHLAELVDDFLLALAEPIRARGIKVVGKNLGTVWAVRTQMEQVVGNLLSNAVKYMGDMPSPTVEIGTVDRDGFVECYIKDSGVGIEPAYHRRIFEIFQRLKEVEAEGTGVGLAIVKKIVESAGGRIWVESEKGQGATFRFTWPKPSKKDSYGSE